MFLVSKGMSWPLPLLLLVVVTTISVSAFLPFSSKGSPPLATPQHHVLFQYLDALAEAPVTKKKDRPLLRDFGMAIEARVRESAKGEHRFGEEGSFRSEDTFPILDMTSSSSKSSSTTPIYASSRDDMHAAYTASQEINSALHGQSSGTGCSIIRLTGDDARSVQGLVEFASDFFQGIDDHPQNHIHNVGVFRVAESVHAGFDTNVNMEDKMQVLYGLLMRNSDDNSNSGCDPTMIPAEVGEIMHPTSLPKGHDGMRTLFDVSKQLVAGVLGMDDDEATKVVDDCTAPQDPTTIIDHNDDMDPAKFEDYTANISNSYQRLIRYMKQPPGKEAPSFWPHVDSTLLTLIPMPELPGLEIWAPSLLNSDSDDKQGEWVQPQRPSLQRDQNQKDDDDVYYVVALAGEFMELLSNGRVPSCIHRVVLPDDTNNQQQTERISAPLFLRPRRTKEAIIDVVGDDYLRRDTNSGMHYQKGLLEECHTMPIWDYMDTMCPDN